MCYSNFYLRGKLFQDFSVSVADYSLMIISSMKCKSNGQAYVCVFFSLQLQSQHHVAFTMHIPIEIGSYCSTMFSLSTQFMSSASHAVRVIQSRTQCNNSANVQSASPRSKEHRCLSTNANQFGHKQGFMTDDFMTVQEHDASNITNIQCFSKCTHVPAHSVVQLL